MFVHQSYKSACILAAILFLATPALAQPLSITTTSPLPGAVAGIAYTPLAFTATGGTPPYSWALTSGSLPAPMTFTGGTLAGTPGTAGIYAFSVTVTDSAPSPSAVQGAFSLTVAPRITTSSLPAWTVNRPYPNTNLTVSGASGPVSWSATGLPPGLGVSGGGVLSGTATSSGQFNVALQATDPSGAVGSASIPLSINPSPAVTDPSPLPTGYRATQYSYQFGTSPVTPGTPPYTWTNLNPLPPGLTLTPGGLLSGIPTNTGLFTFPIQVTDAAGGTGSKTFALVIGTLPVVVTVLVQPPATTVGIPYPPPGSPAQPYFSASSGTGVYLWSATGLPGGLAIDPNTAFLSGTPTLPGLFAASIRATDPLLETDAKTVNIQINAAPQISTTLPPCTAGTLCSRQLIVSGGTGAFTWQLISGTPPAGMSLNTAGVLSGTPQAVASPVNVSFTVKATDSVGASDTNLVSIVINPAIAISPASLPATTSGLAYSQSFSAAGGTGAITWIGTGLPGWLTLSAAGGLTGTAPVVASATNFNFSVRATDSIGAFTASAYSVTVNPAPVITTPSPLPPWTTGRPYTATLAATGGTGALQFTDPGATLPAWLALSTSGGLSGTPPAAGPYNFTVNVTDALGATAGKPFALTINPAPVVTTLTLPATTSGIAYSQPLTNTAGTSPFTWSGTGLPLWLAVNGASLTGTAPAVASPTPFNFSVTVTDTAGAASAPQPLSVTVNPALQITTPNPLASTTSGVFYSQTFTSTGGTGAITWTVTNRPAWLIQNGATLSGTAPVVGAPTNFNFSMTATDAVNASVVQPFTVTVNPGITITTAATLGPWTETRPFTAGLAAAGGIPPYQFTDAGATLPAWLGLSLPGVLSGTPPAPGAYNFTVRVTDSVNASATKQFTLTVNAVPSVNATPLPPTTSGLAYNRTLTAANGTPPLTWATANLPAWLTASGPSLTGIAPVVAASTVYNFSASVTDAAGAVSASQPFSVTVNPPVLITTTSPLPTVSSGVPYVQTFTSTGGTGAITWSVTNRPAWLSQNGATLSGTAPSVGAPATFVFSMTATDAAGAFITQQFSVTVNPGLTITSSSLLGPWTAGSPFTATLTASGGIPPYQFADAGSTLPAWLGLSTAGTLSGTPPAQGTYSFTVKVTDSANATATKGFSLTVNLAPTVGTNSLPATTSGLLYNRTLAVLNGTAPFTWGAVSLPFWLVLNGPSLSGTAPLVAVATPYSFSVTATDAAGAITPAQPLSVTVNPPVSITTTNPLSSTFSGAFYSQTFNATGGTGAITWSFTNRPAWLSQNGATLSGIAPVVSLPVSYFFTAAATDSLGASQTQGFSITVNPGITITTAATLGPWTAAQPYTVTLAAAGGQPPYQFSDPAATLPSWLSLSPNGVLSGTPPAAGAYGFSVRVIDTGGATTTKAFTLAVNAQPAITTSAFPATTSGLTAGLSLALTGGTPPFTWGASNLPAWLSLNGATLSGIAPVVSAATAYSFSVTVTDATGAVSAPLSLTSTVNPPVTFLSAVLLPQAVPGSPYSTSLSAAGGTGALSWSSPNLPAWLSLTGPNLSGTPPLSAAGTTLTITVRATDTLGAFGVRDFQLPITLGGPAITTASPLPPWTVGRPYSAQLAAAGGQAPYGNWIVNSGALPSGLQLDAATGLIHGTPSSAGGAAFTIQFTDAAAALGSKAFQLTINPPPVVTTASLPAGSQGVPYQTTLASTGGTAPIVWSASGLAGTGLSLTPGGVLLGTPVAAGPANINFTAVVTDAAGATGQAPLSIAIGPSISITSNGALPATTSGRTYSVALAATGGTGTLTFSAAAGTLPAWLALTGQGVLSGVAAVVNSPATAGFTITVTDTLGIFASKAFSLTLNPLPSIAGGALAGGTAGAPYSQTLHASGGTGLLTWSSSTLPAWLTLNASTGALSGVPPAAGTFSFSVVATDSLGAASLPASFSIQIDPPGGTPSITATCPFAATTEGLPFSAALGASGGFPPYTWSASGLPAWLTVNSSTGALSGIAAAGYFTFTLRASDSQGLQAARACGIPVNPAPVVSTAALPPGTAGAPYWQTLAGFGGTGSLTWAASGLPAWLALNPTTGVLSGTPPSSGSFSLDVRATDSLGAASPTVTLGLTISASGGLPVITACPLPSGTVGSALSFPLTAALGFPPYAWSVSGLPAGLNATTGGTVSGISSASGTFTVSLQLTDASKSIVSTSCPLTINSGPVVLTSALPDGTAGATYSQTLSAAGGSGLLRWSAASLPAWLNLDPLTGELSGTPAVQASYTLSVQVTDARGVPSPTANLGLIILAPGGLPAITTGCPLPDTTEGLLTSTVFTAKQGVPPYRWAATGQPGGFTMSAAGLFSGTGAPGLITFSVQATDQQLQIATLRCSLTINPKPVITTTALADGTTGVDYLQPVAATGGTGALSWSASGLPAGLTIGPAGGGINGTPLSGGTASVNLRVSDKLGVSAAKSFSLAIAVNPNSPTPALANTCPLTSAAAGVAYTQNLQAAGGTPPYRWFVSNLPAGITFDPATGILSGTAVSGSSGGILIQVIDSQSHVGVATCGLAVTPAAPLHDLAAITPAAKVGGAYTGSLTVAGGVPPYRWSLQNGALPPGIILDPSGTLRGLPTSAGHFVFTVLVTDAAGTSATSSVTIDVAPSLTIATPPALPDGIGGTAYTQALLANGASGNVTWSIRGGALPSGLTLDPATGVISGTPLAAGAFSFTVRAVDALQQQVETLLLITIRLAPLPPVTITGPGATLNPAQQVSVGMTLAAGYPLEIRGTLTLSIVPEASVGIADAQAVFAGGGKTLGFRIPPNATQAVFDDVPAFQSGTLAATIRLDAALQSGGISVSPPSPATVSVQVPRLAPVIVGTPTVIRTPTGIQISLIAFSTTRQVSAAVFHFSGAPGTNLQGTDITVPLLDLVAAWYANPQSLLVGSQFGLVQSFNVQGNAAQITTVTITLSNTVGNSQTVSVTF